MNIQDIGSIGELVAALATIATLGYLAYQIRLNTLHSRAYTQRDILNKFAADQATLAKLSSVIRRGLTRFFELTPDEQFEFSSALFSQTTGFEAVLRLHRSGLVDNDQFVAYRAWILSLLTTSGGNEWWNMVRNMFSVDVREFIDFALDNKIDVPPPITEALPFYGLVDGK